MRVHISSKALKKFELRPIYGNQFGANPLFYNPRGLWYTCGEKDWLQHIKEIESGLTDSNVTIFKYKLDISKLNIKKIATVKELDDFIKKYENNAGKTPVESMNWNQIYKDYDGLEICPYLTMKYGKLFQEIHYTLSFKQKIDIAEKKLGKIPAGIKKELNQLFEDNPKYFKRIWCIGWEVGSGVIWKNYAKIAGI